MNTSQTTFSPSFQSYDNCNDIWLVLEPDNGSFRSGDTVTGFVELCLRNSCTADSLDLKLLGTEQLDLDNVSLLHQSDVKRRHKTCQHLSVFLRLARSLALPYSTEQEEEIDSQKKILAAGTHRIPFSFQLPEQLPASYKADTIEFYADSSLDEQSSSSEAPQAQEVEDEQPLQFRSHRITGKGCISYILHAKLSSKSSDFGDGVQNMSTFLELNIAGSMLDVPLLQELQTGQSLKASTSKRVSIDEISLVQSRFADGTVNFSAQIEQSLCAPGETLRVHIDLFNGSRSRIQNVHAKLIRDMSFCRNARVLMRAEQLMSQVSSGLLDPLCDVRRTLELDIPETASESVLHRVLPSQKMVFGNVVRISYRLQCEVVLPDTSTQPFQLVSLPLILTRNSELIGQKEFLSVTTEPKLESLSVIMSPSRADKYTQSDAVDVPSATEENAGLNDTAISCASNTDLSFSQLDITCDASTQSEDRGGEADIALWRKEKVAERSWNAQSGAPVPMQDAACGLDNSTTTLSNLPLFSPRSSARPPRKMPSMGSLSNEDSLMQMQTRSSSSRVYASTQQSSNDIAEDVLDTSLSLDQGQVTPQVEESLLPPVGLDDYKELEEAGEAQGEVSDATEVTTGSIGYMNGSYYSGQLMNGNIKHGTGKLVYSDGSAYTGEWVADMRHGNGIYTTNKYTYDGSWENDVKSGRGVIMFSSGEQYDGEFADNKPHGQGCYSFRDGQRYIGEFRSGKREGFGTLYYSDGVTVYEGEWLNDQKHGRATVRFETEEYTGQFLNDVKAGFGIYRYANGDIYEGEWQNNKKNGFGRYKFVNGAVLSGPFVNGVKNGRFTLVTGEGQKWAEYYEQGRLKRRAKIVQQQSQQNVQV